jgi:hypothetical protein
MWTTHYGVVNMNLGQMSVCWFPLRGILYLNEWQAGLATNAGTDSASPNCLGSERAYRADSRRKQASSSNHARLQ